MTALLFGVLVFAAVIVVTGLILLAVVVRQTWHSRGEWAEEDREAGEDPRRGRADDTWTGF
jgi:hypothetical protein